MIKQFPLGLQETFDIAYNGVVNQGAPSMSQELLNVCVYEGANGMFCAAGHVFKLIEPDFDYDGADSLDGESAASILYRMGYSQSPVVSDPEAPICEISNLLMDVQSAHDNAAKLPLFVDAYKKFMAEVATKRGLKVPEES
jgi:hypothetical protein